MVKQNSIADLIAESVIDQIPIGVGGKYCVYPFANHAELNDYAIRIRNELPVLASIGPNPRTALKNALAESALQSPHHCLRNNFGQALLRTPDNAVEIVLKVNGKSLEQLYNEFKESALKEGATNIESVRHARRKRFELLAALPQSSYDQFIALYNKGAQLDPVSGNIMIDGDRLRWVDVTHREEDSCTLYDILRTLSYTENRSDPEVHELTETIAEKIWSAARKNGINQTGMPALLTPLKAGSQTAGVTKISMEEAPPALLRGLEQNAAALGIQR